MIFITDKEYIDWENHYKYWECKTCGVVLNIMDTSRIFNHIDYCYITRAKSLMFVGSLNK